MTSTETLPLQTLRISYSRWEPCVGFCGDDADDVICVECGWLARSIRAGRVGLAERFFAGAFLAGAFLAVFVARVALAVAPSRATAARRLRPRRRRPRPRRPRRRPCDPTCSGGGPSRSSTSRSTLRARRRGRAPWPAPRSAGSATISSPDSLRAMRSSSCSRYSSWYFSGSNASAASDSTSWRAIVRSFSVSFTSVVGHELVGGHDLVGVAHRLDAERAVERPDRDEALLAAHHDAPDRDLVERLHRVDEQRVRLLAALVGHEVVGLLEVERVDVVEVDELLDLDLVAPLRAQRLDLARLDDHVLALRDLEAVHDLVGGHLVAGLVGDLAVADARAGPLLELVEAHVFALRRADELHGHLDESEADRPGPDRAGHRVPFYVWRAGPGQSASASRSTAASSRSPTSTSCSTPPPGFRKADVIDYYRRIAPVMLPHLAGPAADPRARARRRGGRAVLREALPAAPSRLGPGVGAARAERRPAQLHRRGPPDARVAREPRRARAAHATSGGSPTSTRRARSCSTSTPARPADVLDCCRVALELRELLDASRPDRRREDVGRQGPAHLGAAERRPKGDRHRRDDQAVRARARPAARGARPEARHGRHGEGRAHRDACSSTGARTTGTRRRSARTRCASRSGRPCRRRSRGTRSTTRSTAATRRAARSRRPPCSNASAAVSTTTPTSLTVHQDLARPLGSRAMELDGKVAIVTGASRGVGAATAIMLAERGCKVACAARATDAAPVPIPGTIDETVRQITDAGGDGDRGADEPRQGRRGRAHGRDHDRALRPRRHPREQRRDHVPRRPRPRHEALRPRDAGRPARAAASRSARSCPR